MKEEKITTLTIQIPVEIKKKIEENAKKEYRSITNYIRKLIIESLEKK